MGTKTGAEFVRPAYGGFDLVFLVLGEGWTFGGVGR